MEETQDSDMLNLITDNKDYLFWVRHGQREDNKGVYHADSCITEYGAEQAQASAKVVKSIISKSDVE